jgi:hypothetical protein
VRPEPSRLPRRETAARDLSRGSVASLPGTPVTDVRPVALLMVESPLPGGLNDYCADLATCSVSMRNFETAACAAVPDLAAVSAFAIDGSTLSSAVA